MQIQNDSNAEPHPLRHFGFGRQAEAEQEAPARPNRAQRRAMQQELARQQRRGQRAFNRQQVAVKPAEVDPVDATARMTGHAEGHAG